MTWISELVSAQLGIIKIGSYPSREDAYKETEKWLEETEVSSGDRKMTMLDLINESFTDDIHIYDTDDSLWEEDYD